MIICTLQQHLDRQSLSQRELSRRTHLHRRTIKRLCAAEALVTVNLAILETLCRALDVPLQDLLVWKEDD